MTNKEIEIFNTYNDALIKSDFATVLEIMADTIIWHQPGNNPLSGDIKGKDNLVSHLGQFAAKSNGTFKVITNWVTSNGNFVTAKVTFVADRGNNDVLNMEGIDLFRIEDGKIQEVWLFSANQDIEDSYWA